MSGNKNANFHSQYLSVFVENGFFTFVTFLLLSILIPLFNSKNNFMIPLVIGTFFFNIFYQLLNETSYWLIIFLFYYISFYNKKSTNNENIY